MIHQFSLTLPPELALDETAFREKLLSQFSLPDTDDVVVRKRRQSIDARNRHVKVLVEAEICAAASEVLTKLGFNDFSIRINHRHALTGV